MSVAVIIPVYNDARSLRSSLAAIAGGSRIPDELIVVDDASTDASGAVAEQLGATVLRLPENAGPAAARNAGVHYTACDIVVFLDADTRVHPTTIASLESRLLANPALAAVIGSYDDCTPEQGVVSQFRNLAHHFVHSTSARAALTFWSGCGAIRRSALLRAGGFDPRFLRPSIEDIELGYRLSAAGERILLEPSIHVSHLKRWTLRKAVTTDIFNRGAPWVELLLARRSAPNDLNITLRHRLSTASVSLAWLMLLLALALPHAGLLAGTLFATAAVLHFDLLAFLSARKGPLFLFAAVPLLLLQQTCNLAAVLLGSWRFTLAPSEVSSLGPAAIVVKKPVLSDSPE